MACSCMRAKQKGAPALKAGGAFAPVYAENGLCGRCMNLLRGLKFTYNYIKIVVNMRITGSIRQDRRVKIRGSGKEVIFYGGH